MPDQVYIAYVGVALSAAAVVILFLVMIFGDLFLTSERTLRRWMSAFTWCVAGGLFATAAAAALTVVQLHH